MSQLNLLVELQSVSHRLRQFLGLLCKSSISELPILRSQYVYVDNEIIGYSLEYFL